MLQAGAVITVLSFELQNHSDVNVFIIDNS